MIYAVSDLHGCYDRYRQLLDKLDLEEQDTLYVLGDALDRGPEGFRILWDMASRPQVVGLLGNHEAMALDALPGLLRGLEHGRASMSRTDRSNASLWFSNGGESSLRDFLLVHGGLEHFSPSRPLEDYSRDEIVWCRPEPETVYFPDRCVVLGHTPTQFLLGAAGNESAQGKIYRTESFIDIDCGCVYPGGRLGCLCLDTMEEIYV